MYGERRGNRGSGKEGEESALSSSRPSLHLYQSVVIFVRQR